MEKDFRVFCLVSDGLYGMDNALVAPVLLPLPNTIHLLRKKEMVIEKKKGGGGGGGGERIALSEQNKIR